MTLYINLLNFKDSKIAGAGYFMKRIFESVSKTPAYFKNVDKVVILCSNKVDIQEVMSLPKDRKVRIVRMPFVNSTIIRILYEQLILPFLLSSKKGYFYSPTPAVPLVLPLLNKKMEVISTIHDMIPFHVKGKYGYFRSQYIKLLSVFSAKCADRIITVSQFSKNDIVSITNVEPQKITVVYNFIPERQLETCHVSKPYFITICTIEPGKNIDLMIKGFSLFLLNNPHLSHYKYYIIGKSGWDSESIVKLVDELNLASNVKFLGYVTEETKNDYIKYCTGMLYMSKFEGFGIPILEALYFNKPSIVSNVSSLPEVVGRTGIICKRQTPDAVAEALERVISSNGEYIKNIPVQLSLFDSRHQLEEFTKALGI